MTEAQTRVRWPQAMGCHQPQELGHMEQILPWTLQKEPTLPTARFGLLATRTMRPLISFVLSHYGVPCHNQEINTYVFWARQKETHKVRNQNRDTGSRKCSNFWHKMDELSWSHLFLFGANSAFVSDARLANQERQLSDLGRARC